MKLAVIFNGQGAHYEDMGQGFDQSIYQLAEELTNLPIRNWISNEIGQLSQTRNSQAAIVATSMAIYHKIKDKLPAISYMAGLSLGEYSALMASGMLSMEDGFPLVKGRGEIMSQQCAQLAEEMKIQMAAVIDMPLEEIETLIATVHNNQSPLYLANFNSRQQIVIAGASEAIKEFRKKAKDLGYRKVIPLKVEGPFHTPMMADVKETFTSLLNNIQFQPSDIEVISNVTVESHNLSNIKTNLLEHFTQPVKWYQTIDKLKEKNVSHIIQIGPGNTLAKLLGDDDRFKVLVVDKIKDIESLASFL